MTLVIILATLLGLATVLILAMIVYYAACLRSRLQEKGKKNDHWSQYHFSYGFLFLLHDKYIIYETRICAAEMAVGYAALSACRKVHP